MRASQIPGYLKHIYQLNAKNPERRASVILLGPPGVGKTVSVKKAAMEIAGELGRRFVDLGAADSFEPGKDFGFLAFSILHADPVDFMGVPRDSGASVEYRLPRILDVFTRPSAKGIIFIDEATLDTREDRRAALLKLVDEGMIGYRPLSSGVLVVLAGNTREWSAMAQDLDEPMRRGRARIVFVDPPTVDEWIDYMNDVFGDGWDRRIAGYLKIRPDALFVKRDENEDDGYAPLASPRNWTNLALALVGCDPEIAETEVKALLPPDLAAEVMTFLKTYVPPIEEILKRPEAFRTLSREAKYLLLVQLRSREDELDKFVELYRIMDNESFAVLHALRTKDERRKFANAIRTHYPDLFRKMESILGKSRDLSIMLERGWGDE